MRRSVRRSLMVTARRWSGRASGHGLPGSRVLAGHAREGGGKGSSASFRSAGSVPRSRSLPPESAPRRPRPASTVRIWDAATGHERAVLAGHDVRIAAVAVAPDGRWLALACWDRTVRIWDAATGDERAVMTRHTGPVFAVAVTPDGSWFSAANQDKKVRIWDAATGHERAILTGHTGTVREVAVAPDSRLLASAGEDATVRIWDVATGHERTATKTGIPGEFLPAAMAVAVAPNGSWLAWAETAPGKGRCRSGTRPRA